MKKHAFLLACGYLLCWSPPAWAVQVHGDPEGYLVHQMGHLFFIAALVSLLCVLVKRPPGRGTPWRHLKISLTLFLLWNIDTTLVHWLAYRLPEEAFLFAGGSLFDDHLLLPLSGRWLFYYLGSFDHLLCVPASWFLIMSLRGFCVEATVRQNQTGIQAP